MPPVRKTVVVDFDGTVTVDDLLDAAAKAFGDPEAYARADEGLDERTLTLHEVLRLEYEPVRAPLADVVDWVLSRARIRPGFHEFVTLARERGWRLVILSSGFHELIGPVLAQAGLSELELLANSVEPDPGGWRIHFRDETVCGSCGEPCKRATVERLAEGELVYVGDGFSDRCAAKRADLVFARRSLATYLDAESVPYQPFDDFFQVADGIVTASS